MAKREEITEQLKTANQTEWIRRMNNIQTRATEIMNAKLIYEETKQWKTGDFLICHATVFIKLWKSA